MIEYIEVMGEQSKLWVFRLYQEYSIIFQWHFGDTFVTQWHFCHILSFTVTLHYCIVSQSVTLRSLTGRISVTLWLLRWHIQCRYRHTLPSHIYVTQFCDTIVTLFTDTSVTQWHFGHTVKFPSHSQWHYSHSLQGHWCDLLQSHILVIHFSNTCVTLHCTNCLKFQTNLLKD